jgi:hypothetical protein
VRETYSGVTVADIAAWCADRVDQDVRNLRWRVIASNKYTVALSVSTRADRYFCKFAGTVFARDAPDQYRTLSRTGAPVAPRLIGAEGLGDGAALLFEYVDLVRQRPATSDILAALADVQRPAAGLVRGASAQLRFEVARADEELRSVAEGSETGTFSARLVRWAGVSLTELRAFSRRRFVSEWMPRVREWSSDLSVTDIPDSLDHADLAITNTGLARDGRCILFDWDDARVASPFLSIDKLVVEHGLDVDSSELRRYSDQLGGSTWWRRSCVAGAALGALRDWQRIRLTLGATGRKHLQATYATAWAVRTRRSWSRLAERGRR